jgi:hypothetical protein
MWGGESQESKGRRWKRSSSSRETIGRGSAGCKGSSAPWLPGSWLHTLRRKPARGTCQTGSMARTRLFTRALLWKAGPCFGEQCSFVEKKTAAPAGWQSPRAIRVGIQRPSQGNRAATARGNARRNPSRTRTAPRGLRDPASALRAGQANSLARGSV